MVSSSRPVRVVIVGAGNVGATFAYALLFRGLAAEIVLIDANHARAEGEAMDLNHAEPFTHPTRIWAGDYDDCAGAAIVVISAGAGQRPGETRLDLVRKNADIFAKIIPEVARRKSRRHPSDRYESRRRTHPGLAKALRPASQSRNRFRHHSGHSEVSLLTRRAFWRRGAQRSRLHHRRARRQRSSGLVAGEHRRPAPRRLRRSERNPSRAIRPRRHLPPHARRRLPYHRAQGSNLLRRRRRTDAHRRGHPSRPAHSPVSLEPDSRLLRNRRALPEPPDSRRTQRH